MAYCKRSVTCGYNKFVDCRIYKVFDNGRIEDTTVVDCNTCGWNPKVRAARLKEYMEKRKENKK